jgi:hypothetical protein
LRLPAYVLAETGAGENFTIARRSAHSLIFPCKGIHIKVFDSEAQMGEKGVIKVPFVERFYPLSFSLSYTKSQSINSKLFYPKYLKEESL